MPTTITSAGIVFNDTTTQTTAAPTILSALSGTVSTAQIANNAVTAAKLGTTERLQLCKSFVNFNGTGTPAIRSSYNVSSITKNGTGDYTVNFETPMADANYCINAMTTGNTAWSNLPHIYASNSQTTISCRISVNATNLSGAGIDPEVAAVTIFGN